VLADHWDKGWRAYVNDIEVPIYRVNYVLRGVRVDSGASTIRFIYASASFSLGLAISAGGGIGWLAWAFIFVRRLPKGMEEVPKSRPSKNRIPLPEFAADQRTINTPSGEFPNSRR